MKLLVTPYRYPKMLGGVEVFSYYLSKVFPDLVCVTGEDVERHTPGLSRVVGKLISSHSICSLLTGRMSKKMAEKTSVDAILTNGFFGWYLTLVGALKRIDIPTLNIFHGCYAGVADYVLNSYNKLSYYHYKYYRGFLEYLSARGKTAVVSVSELTRILLRKYYGVESTVIPNGVDLDAFSPIKKDSARKMLNLPRNKKVGIFVGTSSYSKGFDIILRLAKKCPDIVFLAVSPQRTSAGVSQNILSYPSVSHTKMRTFYSAADFFILPSRFEGCNISILEAMACDIPIVTSSTGSFYTMKGDQSFGVVLPSQSTDDDYETAILNVISGKNELSPRIYVNQWYSFDLFRNRYNALLARLIKD